LPFLGAQALDFINHQCITLNDQGSKQVLCALWDHYFGNDGALLFCRRNLFLVKRMMMFVAAFRLVRVGWFAEDAVNRRLGRSGYAIREGKCHMKARPVLID
jgi:ABC-type branched-subunit amino acid transport system permease subunit